MIDEKFHLDRGSMGSKQQTMASQSPRNVEGSPKENRGHQLHHFRSFADHHGLCGGDSWASHGPSNEGYDDVLHFPEKKYNMISSFCVSESAKFSEDPSFKMTLGRMVDMTYRVNVGLVSLSIERAKEMGDPEAWVKAASPVI